MKVLFCNTNEPACGVHQFGLNLYEILKGSPLIQWQYYDGLQSPPMVMVKHFDLLLYNWQALVGGWMVSAPIRVQMKQALVYHDCDLDESRWDAILFSDPTMTNHGKWHSIGRPLPEFRVITPEPHKFELIVGVHGFMGAWADRVVQRVINEFESATIRLQLPFSKFCDPDGTQARAMSDRCRSMISGNKNIRLEISHEFLSQQKLLLWLQQNTINCYFRPSDMIWRGVSSAPDSALMIRKPISVSRCNAFRHLHGVSPSICIEDSSITEIIRNGLSPLVMLYQQWSPSEVRKQVETVLLNL